MDKQVAQNIAIEVIRTLKSRFDSFPEDASNNRNAPFHEAFLGAFTEKFSSRSKDLSIPIFISMSSWMHGLNTTLGQSFFENVSHILCNGQKKEFKGLKITKHQQSEISTIITQLKNGHNAPNLFAENTRIFQQNGSLDTEVDNFTADCYTEDATKIVCIEIKTVKPNSSVFKSEKDKMLQAKAALKNQYPNKDIEYFLAFPFDPLSSSPTGSNKGKYMDYSVDCKTFIHPEEVLLADEFWSYLSGEVNTMQKILDIINAIANPEFLDNLNFINNYDNIRTDVEKYKQILDTWYLREELEIVDTVSKLLDNLPSKKATQNLLYQGVFKTNGSGISYNQKRFETFKKC